MRFKTFAIGLSVCAFIALAARPSDAAPRSHRVQSGPGWGDCVRTVRALSDFTIRGDAWTWWNTAAGEYARDDRPAVGSVLVFKRSPRMGRGHVSLVSGVVDSRTVLVDHTWIAGRGIKRNMRVVDVSAGNDWSAVRVWHDPTAQLGQRVYPTYGFILPEGGAPQRDVLQVAARRDAGRVNVAAADESDNAVTPRGRKPQRKPTATTESAADDSPAVRHMFSPVQASALMMIKPQRKPTQATRAAAPHAAAVKKPVAVPARKPKAT